MPMDELVPEPTAAPGPAEERLMQLERALLDRGAERVGYDATGEPDRDQLIAQMARLGFTFRGCEQRAYAWTATFRGPTRPGQRPVEGTATAASSLAALMDAALEALQAVPVARERAMGLPPSGWVTWRRSRPWRRTTITPPAIS